MKFGKECRDRIRSVQQLPRRVSESHRTRYLLRPLQLQHPPQSKQKPLQVTGAALTSCLLTRSLRLASFHSWKKRLHLAATSRTFFRSQLLLTRTQSYTKPMITTHKFSRTYSHITYTNQKFSEEGRC
ncbi:hypothetical protein MDA_GLEAN10004451 [Myotis davidii]|uniref:Uncharacterized protein n=1 Tax=Myotis davidii TaxID=225400 RepID=L5LYV5_MYODS|nr:hypothetical protein MDA_GLEAN10004451 [Myotis davidii]